ncbi:hypothetical protein [Oceanitalea stevensii]|nr:hypothetical protein [Oceanitalea stevensii]
MSRVITDVTVSLDGVVTGLGVAPDNGPTSTATHLVHDPVTSDEG